MQGDPLKEVLCIPYVLAAKYQSYFNKPWDEPLIIEMDLAAEMVLFKIFSIQLSS
jgi:hypothetical protein